VTARHLRTRAEHTAPNGDVKEEQTASEDYPLALLSRDPETAPAAVTVSLDGKVSDHLYWGPNTFDRVSYSVSVFCSVRLACDQGVEAIRTATGIAHGLAWEGVSRGLRRALADHTAQIRELYPDYFHKDDDDAG